MPPYAMSCSMTEPPPAAIELTCQWIYGRCGREIWHVHSPEIVTWDALPPKSPIYDWTHCRAVHGVQHQRNDMVWQSMPTKVLI